MVEIRILYAEDELTIRIFCKRSIAMALKNRETNIIACEDGRKFLEEALKSKYDLLITDNRMPELTGIEALEELRRRGNYTPALLLTGTPEDYIAQIKNVKVLEKPFKLEELTKSISELLDC